MDDRDAMRPRAEAEPGGLSPVRAFILLGTVAILIAAGVTVFRDPAPAEPRPTTAPSPDFSLTNAEALAEFERLKDLLDTAYGRRDITLVDEFAAPDAAEGIQRIDDEIRTLLSDGVLYKTDESRKSLVVTANDPQQVELREVVVKTPRFVDEDTGKNLATATRPERQEVEWVIRRYGIDWRIVSATIVSAERVNR